IEVEARLQEPYRSVPANDESLIRRRQQNPPTRRSWLLTLMNYRRTAKIIGALFVQCRGPGPDLFRLVPVATASRCRHPPVRTQRRWATVPGAHPSGGCPAVVECNC